MVRSRHRRNPRYRRLNTSASANSGRGMIRCAALLLLIVVTGLGTVSLRSRTEALERDAQQARSRLAVQGRQLENLRMKYEAKTDGGYILSKVEELGLGLQPPLLGQVRRMSVPRRPATEEVEDDDLIARR